MKLFAGRMNRSTYLLAVLVTGLVAIILSRPEVQTWLDANDLGTLLIVLFVAIPLIIWQLATAGRRLHDIGLTGWLAILLVLPGMQLFLLLMPGTKGKNKYGPSPTQHLDLTALVSDKTISDI